MAVPSMTEVIRHVLRQILAFRPLSQVNDCDLRMMKRYAFIAA